MTDQVVIVTDSFSTSAATPMEYIDAYRELGKQGRDILCIIISYGGRNDWQ